MRVSKRETRQTPCSVLRKESSSSLHTMLLCYFIDISKYRQLGQAELVSTNKKSVYSTIQFSTGAMSMRHLEFERDIF